MGRLLEESSSKYELWGWLEFNILSLIGEPIWLIIEVHEPTCYSFPVNLGLRFRHGDRSLNLFQWPKTWPPRHSKLASSSGIAHRTFDYYVNIWRTHARTSSCSYCCRRNCRCLLSVCQFFMEKGVIFASGITIPPNCDVPQDHFGIGVPVSGCSPNLPLVPGCSSITQIVGTALMQWDYPLPWKLTRWKPRNFSEWINGSRSTLCWRRSSPLSQDKSSKRGNPHDFMQTLVFI